MKNSHSGKVAVRDSLCANETIIKVTTPFHNCKITYSCSGMYELGRMAAEYHTRHGGNKLDLLASLTDNLCGPYSANLYTGYFITKEKLEL